MQFRLKSSQLGFSALELMLSLVIFVFLITVGNKIMHNSFKIKQDNQAADQIKHFSQIAINYLTNNYSKLLQNSIAGTSQVISIAQLKAGGYFSLGENAITTYGQVPCLYVSNIKKSTLSAYLFLAIPITKKMTRLDATQIISNLGAIAGVLVKSNDDYIIKGSINDNSNARRFSAAEIATMNQQCNFSADKQIAINSIVVDLTRDKSLFAQIKTVNTSLQDASLKRFGDNDATTMQTNIYLDNIIKEPSSSTKYYCDTAKVPTAEAIILCQNMARVKQLNYTGNATWVSYNLLPNNVCQYNANGMFAATTYSCDVSTFGSAGAVCASVNMSNAKYYEPAYWSVGSLSGSKCYNNQAIGRFDHNVCKDVVNKSDYWQNFCRASNSMGCNCDGGGYVPYFLYDKSTDSCTTSNEWTCNGRSFMVSGVAPPNAYNAAAIREMNCGYRDFAATAGFGPNQSLVCGSNKLPAFEESKSTPAQHMYKAIDFGLNFSGDKRIQIKTAAPIGSALSTSQLNINNAGIQAGYVVPISNPILAGHPCTANDIGKIAGQQFSNTFGVGGQLQCTYNPTYCTTNYCYLPLKPASIIYTFSNLRANVTCPAGLLVGENQPSDGITAVQCTPFDGWMPIVGIHAIKTGCYSNITGFSSCPIYKSVCTYKSSEDIISDFEVPAIKKVLCSAVSNNFIIDNFRNN